MPSAMQIPAPPFLDKPQASYGVLIDDLELYHAIFQTWCIVPKLLYIVNMKSCAGLSNGVISNDLEWLLLGFKVMVLCKGKYYSK